MVVSRKLLYLITQDWYFVSHRESLAKAAYQEGFDVALVTQVETFRAYLNNGVVKLYPIDFHRSLKSVIQEIRTINQIFQSYQEFKPELIHQVSIKPILYGSLAIFLGANQNKKSMVINSFTGLGYVFTAQSIKARLLRAFLVPVFRQLFSNNNFYFVFQNKIDRDLFIKLNIVNISQCFLIPGSGVETDKFTPVKKKHNTIIIALIARMLIEKGVYEFVSAAEQLKQQYGTVKFVLVGDTDVENPSGISQEQLDEWHKTGVVECWGRQDDMPSIYAQCDIVVLPSYREGLPKVLLEAQACEIPVVTTDVPGCRDAIIPDETGLLVPVRNPEALANAIEKLLSDEKLRRKMGKRGRELVVEKFSSLVINSQFINIYNDILTTG